MKIMKLSTNHFHLGLKKICEAYRLTLFIHLFTTSSLHFVVLKYANSVLKGYATAVSVAITGVLSAQLFGTHLSVLFGMGMINVLISVLLYNLGGLDDFCF